jgi:hypothetical protein
VRGWLREGLRKPTGDEISAKASFLAAETGCVGTVDILGATPPFDASWW